MPDGYSSSDVFDFLDHAAARGLIPATTARGLAIASRNVLGVLSDEETQDVRGIDLESAVRRFQNKRARDFTPSSLRTYEQRTRRAITEFLAWREDPANFRTRTRNTAPRKREENSRETEPALFDDVSLAPQPARIPQYNGTGYQTALPLRPGHVVFISNVPENLTAAEAERLANFVRMLAVEPLVASGTLV
jgi:hypothetical protein